MLGKVDTETGPKYDHKTEWMDKWFAILRPFQQYFNHIRTMGVELGPQNWKDYRKIKKGTRLDTLTPVSTAFQGNNYYFHYVLQQV